MQPQFLQTMMLLKIDKTHTGTIQENLRIYYFCPMISIERLMPADAPMLSTIGSISLLQSHGHSAPAEIMQAYVGNNFNEEAILAELLDETNIFYAAFYNGEPAGYFKTTHHVPHHLVTEQAVTKLSRLYVLNQYFNYKLGQPLLHKAVEISKAAGDKGMWLNVWKENPRAIRFYQKQGFKIVGESLFVLTETHANPNWVMLLEY